MLRQPCVRPQQGPQVSTQRQLNTRRHNTLHPDPDMAFNPSCSRPPRQLMQHRLIMLHPGHILTRLRPQPLVHLYISIQLRRAVLRKAHDRLTAPAPNQLTVPDRPLYPSNPRHPRSSQHTARHASRHPRRAPLTQLRACCQKHTTAMLQLRHFPDASVEAWSWFAGPLRYV
ncbi:hypothetical protein BDV98DRAFT_422003 [Pterulicium gracile]|uniref:Uncharacterized protein n=1 Tax=Pterulicium gracile TaxID=1884261 RepID=A0A5C3Q4C9_9AGAR|nr:hypothetical protein BDV98DRAFT_422003 [Pterula gracilis]